MSFRFLRAIQSSSRGLRPLHNAPPHKRSPRPGVQHRRLLCEPLEDRRMLSLGSLVQTVHDPGTYPQERAEFGYSVAADGNLTVVGSPMADVGGVSNAGRAFVMDSTTGALVATLENPRPVADADFGIAVAISGNTVVVGCCQQEASHPRVGLAYIFDATTAALRQTLDYPGVGTMFGYSVGVSGSIVAVGVPSHARLGGLSACSTPRPGRSCGRGATQGRSLGTVSAIPWRFREPPWRLAHRPTAILRPTSTCLTPPRGR